MLVVQIYDDEWWIGPSLEACVEGYQKLVDEVVPEDEVTILTEEKMSTLLFQVTDENEVHTGEVRTFLAQRDIEVEAGGTFPRMFACSP